MSLLKIIVAPDPVLKKRAEEVTEITPEICQILDDMLETMYAAPGVGLAAPQVGILKRLLVIDVANKEEGEKPNPYQLINPEIISVSEDKNICQEGCLSVPDFFEEVERPARCTVKALNKKGEVIEINAEGLLATCIQHEIDHLNGVLFVDHVSRLKRSIILKKLTKFKKSGAVFHPNLNKANSL